MSGLWSGTPSWDSFLYYTVLSNVLCLVWMVWSAIVTVRDAQAKGWYGFSTPSARGEAAVMEAITVTMLIYLFMFAPHCSHSRARTSRSRSPTTSCTSSRQSS